MVFLRAYSILDGGTTVACFNTLEDAREYLKKLQQSKPYNDYIIVKRIS